MQSVYCIDCLLGRLGFNAVEGQEIFVFPQTSRMCLVATQPYIQWVVSFMG